MKVLNNASETFVKIAIIGHNGTGKTWLGQTAPNPLTLVVETQARASIESSRAVRGAKTPGNMIQMETSQDFRNVILALRQPKDKPFEIKDDKGNVLYTQDKWPDSVVVDSVSDVFDMFRRELITKEAPLNIDSSGLPDETYQHRKVLVDRCIAFLKAMRDCPVHVVHLALLDVKEGWKGRPPVWSPQAPSKEVGAALMAASNMVGITERVPTEKGVLYGVLFEGAEWMPTKRLPPLRDREPGNIANWIKQIQGTWKDALPEKPPVSENMAPYTKKEAV